MSMSIAIGVKDMFYSAVFASASASVQREDARVEELWSPWSLPRDRCHQAVLRISLDEYDGHRLMDLSMIREKRMHESQTILG